VSDESPCGERPQLDLAFERRGERTVLARRRFRWPFVLTRTFALDSRPSHMLSVIVQTSSGAVHGEDRLGQRFEVGEGAAAYVTTQGASPVHRAGANSESRDRASLAVSRGGYLEYLPEARILFPDSALDQTIEIECASGGMALAADAFTIHDLGGGRGFRRFRSTTVLRCDGDLKLVDRADIDSLGASGGAGFRAFSSVVIAAPGSETPSAALAEDLSAALASIAGLYAAASPLPGNAGVGVRLAARELRDLRRGMAAVWFGVRRALTGAAPASRRKGDDGIEWAEAN
jgi:urease accessory protein